MRLPDVVAMVVVVLAGMGAMSMGNATVRAGVAMAAVGAVVVTGMRRVSMGMAVPVVMAPKRAAIKQQSARHAANPTRSR